MKFVIQVSETVLARMVTRSFRFLVGLARSPRLMATMRSRGFTPEVQAQGWALIDTISGRGATSAPAPGESDESVERAIEGIDVWVTTNVPILKATLRHRFPEQYAFLFTDDVTVAHGNDAVRTAATLVARFEAMTSAPEREATRADDTAALALVATRGITVADRTRLATRVRLVQHVGAATKASGDGVPSVAPPAKDDPRVDLYVWFTEWSEIGRVVIGRRADLIKLGLASPRRARAADGEEGDEEGSDDEDVIDAKDEAQDDAKVTEEPSVAAAPAKAVAPKRAPAKPSPRGTPSSAPSPA